MTYMKTVDGIDYISTEESETPSCKNCVAYGNSVLCDKLNEYPEPNYFDMCLDLNIIWITKEEEK